ncbi:MAG TPA: phospholipid carrier-dependent glycosyltransferase [Candidatus Saccharimonadales bacterium]|nr:phospholipid carrier-dependent glycosyltransferase [Candidatus Saccharimonadales bacterium]
MISKNLKTILILSLISLVGLFWSLYHIEFGLPHSFHADEPEITELAIKYTFEFKDVVKSNNYYKLIPVSYVYGALPSYIFTIATMIFTKSLNIFGISFDKTTLFIYMRVVNVLLSFLIAPLAAFLYFKVFKDRAGTILTFFLVALNWKFIVHAHYVNADTLLTLLVLAAITCAYFYSQSDFENKYTILCGIFMGLAIGTKITAGLSLIPFAYLYFRKKDLVGFTGLILTILLFFMLSNPFAIIFHGDFVSRIYQLEFKENGLVFDSADANPLKYILALIFIATPLVAVISLYGKFVVIKFSDAKTKDFHIFLLANIAVYLAFFSLSSRNVDRWLLPIIPVVLIYAAYGLVKLKSWLLIFVDLASYMILPALLLLQFQVNTPKSSAYLWMQKNVPQFSTKYVVTEEGLDPMNKLQFARVHKFNVYESDNAQLDFPPDPSLYNYVVLSSKPMDYYKNPIVKQKYPFYFAQWQGFENKVTNSQNFELVQSFVLPKPNLVNLSDVFIYKNIQKTFK